MPYALCSHVVFISFFNYGQSSHLIQPNSIISLVKSRDKKVINPSVIIIGNETKILQIILDLCINVKIDRINVIENAIRPVIIIIFKLGLYVPIHAKIQVPMIPTIRMAIEIAHTKAKVEFI